MESGNVLLASVSFLDTLAEIACQTIPVEFPSNERNSFQRPRAMSEPYGGKNMTATTTTASGFKKEPPPTSMMMPQMLEKYSSIYNKNGRIGIYTREERDTIITRFYEKRKKRVWKKRIRYHCRKNLADSRIRVKGRFVKNQTEDDDEDDDSQEEEEKMKDALVALLKVSSQLPFNGTSYDLDLTTPSKPTGRSSTKRSSTSNSSSTPTSSASSSASSAQTLTPSWLRNNVVKEDNCQDEKSSNDNEINPDDDMTSSIAESVRRRKRMRRHSIAY